MARYPEETQKKAKELRIIDDTLFRLVASRPKVCEEILRTLLDDEFLKVTSVTTQKSLESLNRCVILDALCTLGDGTLCNIEMQTGTSYDDFKRVRLHTALLTANHTPKGTDFKDIPNVKVLYITEYDALKNGQVVTHVSRCQNLKGVYIPVDDGEDIIFANTAIKTGDKKSKLLQLFLKKESFNDKDYPNLSEAIQHFKDSKEGQDKMCKVIEEYANERAKQVEQQTAEEAVISSARRSLSRGINKSLIIQDIFDDLSKHQILSSLEEAERFFEEKVLEK